MEPETYQLQQIRSLEDLESLSGNWVQLLEGQSYPSFLQHPSQCLPLLQSNNAQFCLFVLRKADDIQCLIPCLVQNKKFRLKLGLIKLFSVKNTELKALGDDFIYSPNANPRACISRFFENIACTKDIDSFYVEQVREESELFSFLNSDKDWFINHAADNNIVRQLLLPPSHDEYLSAMKRKVRYNLKRTVKKFEQKFINNYQLIEYCQPSQTRELLNHVDFLYNKSWQKNIKGAQKRNSLKSITNRTKQAEMGCLRSFVLFCENKPIAFVLGTQYKGTLNYEETGYDPLFTEYSPGTIMNYLMIEKLYASNTPEILDFGFGENTYKKIFGNHYYTAFNVTAAISKTKLHMALLLQNKLNKLYSFIHSFLIKTQLDAKVRKLIKRK